MDKKDCILYIDDEKDNLSVFESVFQWDYDIVTTTNAKEGLDILKTKDIKVIISDQRMPEMTGLDFFKITSKKYPTAIRIILTGYTDTDVIIDAINKGNIYRYITKPWKKEEVNSAIKGAIQLFDLQSENKRLMKDLQNLVIHLEETVQARTRDLLDEISNRNKITSVLAHDIRNSFNTILLATDYLNKKLNEIDFEKVSLYISDINKLSLQSSKLLETILEWSFSGNSSEVKPENLILSNLIQSNIDFLKAVAGQKHITFNIDISNDINVIFDKNMLNVIIRNITGNAIKFTPENGMISFSVKENKDNIELKIKDNGIGMDNETLEKLFDSDQPLTQLGTNGEQGTGLGLVICKDFALKNSGEINVSSAIGKGTTFTVVLPKK